MLDSSRSGWEYEGEERSPQYPEDGEAAAGFGEPSMSPGGIKVTADTYSALRSSTAEAVVPGTAARTATIS